MNKIKNFYLNYKHGMSMLIFGAIYMVWFYFLESSGPKTYRIIHMPVDDYIPFCEVFVIPYYLWFGYVAINVLFFIIKSKEDYYKLFKFLATGMTLFLIISTFWPNGQQLRPVSMPRDNFLTDMVACLYRTDTPTNLWPSIHVYNSLGVHFAIANSHLFEKKKWVKNTSLVLCISIILSTMFIKQHSVFDVLTAFALAAIMYGFIYSKDMLAVANTTKAKKKVA